MSGLRIALAVAGAAAFTSGITDGWQDGARDDTLAVVAALMFLTAIWLIRYAFGEAARGEALAAENEARARAAEAECETLRYQKRALAGFVDWLSNGVTTPMQFAATRPQPVLRAVRRHYRR